MRAHKTHIASFVFFGLALVFYFFAINLAIALGVVGMLLELVAWLTWVSKDNPDSRT